MLSIKRAIIGEVKLGNIVGVLRRALENELGETESYFSGRFEGGRAVLLVHGFTGSPHSLLGAAKYFEAHGFDVALPRLPGHGTTLGDLLEKTFDDWYATVAEVACSIRSKCSTVDLFGLSMGGAMALKLCQDVSGLRRVVLVNPLIEPPAASFIKLLESILGAGFETAPGISSDIAKPGIQELGYSETPIRAALSLFRALPDIQDRLGDVENEILLYSSRRDHVVPRSSGDLLASSLTSAKLERVWLERSYHVATLDYDAELINQMSLEFFNR